MKHPILALSMLMGLLLTGSAQAQGTPYDCFNVYSFTGATSQTGQSNSSSTAPCIAWRVTYTTTGFSSVTVKFQTSPDSSLWTDVVNSICSSTVQPPCVTDGANPLAAGVMGSSSFRAYGKYVRVSVTSVTGSGTGQVVVYGYKGTSASAATGGGGGAAASTAGIAFVDASLCDGVADATSDIQTKLNDATIGTVFIPAGNCLFSGITIPGGKSLQCVGRANLADATIISKLTYTGSGVAITGQWSAGPQNRMSILNCAIFKQGTKGGTAIQSFSSAGSFFQGNQIYNFTNGLYFNGALDFGVYDDTAISNSFSTTTNAITSSGSGANVANRINLSYNTIVLANRGIDVCSSCINWNIMGSDIECFVGTGAYGIFIQGTAGAHTLLTNWIEANSCNTADHTYAIWGQGNNLILNNSLPTGDSGSWDNLVYNVSTTVINPYVNTTTGGQWFIPTVRFRFYTVSTLPSNPIGGQTTGVTDALNPVFGSPVVGGGSVVIPVFYNGSAWIVG